MGMLVFVVRFDYQSDDYPLGVAMIRVSVLMENSLVGHRGLLAEHGLSLLVEDGDKSILFDTGSSEKFLYNACQLQKDLTLVQKVVLTHCHYDHTGGFVPFLEAHTPLELYTGKDFFMEHYEHNGFSHTYLGSAFTKKTLESHQITHTEVLNTTQISDHCVIVSGFPRDMTQNYPSANFEKFDGLSFFCDDFSDECCLVLDTPAGLQLFVGCAHIGILTMVAHISKLFNRPIQGIYGGIHLMNSSQDEILSVITALSSLGVKRYGLCHCSGTLVGECLAQSIDDIEFVHLGTGSVLFW